MKNKKKNIVFRKVNRVPKPKKWVSSWPQTAQNVMRSFAWHIVKLQLSAERAATKMKLSLDRLRYLMQNPMMLDLDTICRMEALILRDLVYVPSRPQAFFRTFVSPCILDIDNYLVASRRKRILGSPRRVFIHPSPPVTT
jgi:hypothetical protein